MLSLSSVEEMVSYLESSRVEFLLFLLRRLEQIQMRSQVTEKENGVWMSRDNCPQVANLGALAADKPKPFQAFLAKS